MDNQKERREYLLNRLLEEGQFDGAMDIPRDEQGQKNLLRALLNVRMPKPARAEFLRVQDAYLQEEIARKGITDMSDLSPVEPRIYLYHPAVRGHRQRGQQPDVGLLCARTWMH